MARPSAVLLYDGACGLCCRSVRFAFRRDPRGAVRYAPLDSDAARRLLARHGLPPGATGTVVLVEGARASTRSTAALRALLHLRRPWPWVGRVGLLVPRPLRDGVYRVVARHRRRWFGGPEACPLPPPGFRERMLE